MDRMREGDCSNLVQIQQPYDTRSMCIHHTLRTGLGEELLVSRIYDRMQGGEEEWTFLKE